MTIRKPEWVYLLPLNWAFPVFYEESTTVDPSFEVLCTYSNCDGILRDFG